MRLAEAHHNVNTQTFAYLFDWQAAFGNGGLGACHALELPFVFGTVDLPFVTMFVGAGPEAMELSAKMQSAWASFAAAAIRLMLKSGRGRPTSGPACDDVPRTPGRARPRTDGDRAGRLDTPSVPTGTWRPSHLSASVTRASLWPGSNR